MNTQRILSTFLSYLLLWVTALIPLYVTQPIHAQTTGSSRYYTGIVAPLFCAQGRDYWINTATGVPDNLRLNSCTAADTWKVVGYSYGITAPATCSVGQTFFDTDAVAGSNWFGCTAANTWTLLSGAGGGSGNVTGPAAGTGGEIVTVSAAGIVLSRSSLTGVIKVVSGVPSVVTGTGTNFVRVDGTSAAGNTGDVGGPASSVNNTIVIFDLATGKVIKMGTGCTIDPATGRATCTGGFASGDGTVQSGAIFPELTANGSNDFRIYGGANQAADGCIVYSGALGSGEAFRGSASTVTVDSKTCRVMEVYTPSAGGYTTVMEEGSALTQRATVNFIGATITCVDNSGSTRTDCTITAGGSAISLANSYCFIMSQCSTGFSSYTSTVALDAACTAGAFCIMKVNLPFDVPLKRIVTYQAATTGNATSLSLAFYADSSGSPGTKVSVTDCRLSTAAPYTGFNDSACDPGTTVLVAGSYWVGYSSETAITQYPSMVAGTASPQQYLGRISKGVGTCSTAVTGTGVTYTLPSGCGTFTPITNQGVPIVMISGW